MQPSKPIIHCVDWQTIDYPAAWNRQEQLFAEKLQQKASGLLPDNDFILCQHLPVYTLGRHGHASNMLLSEEQLANVGAALLRVDRGGDITFHGPGQWTGYPIMDLEQFHIGLKNYIFLLEQLIINVLAVYGIRGERLQGATGVWIEPHTAQARKICAIGVRASRFVTMHGFALNVNTNLAWFSYINPCGFTDKTVTSMQKELSRQIDMDEVRDVLFREARSCFSEPMKYIK
ncbi:MAG TPA: lipoate--protein ligase [Bacteroidales bacterium]|nr:lipoate--protein ligase [Bacteroidales bacterium]